MLEELFIKVLSPSPMVLPQRRMWRNNSSRIIAVVEAGCFLNACQRINDA